MKRKIRILLLTTVVVSFSTVLHAEIDENFVKMNSMVNKSFIKSVAKNRASMGSENAAYVEVDGKQEFKEALESGELNTNLQKGNGITKQYIYKDIKNVDIKDRDLRNIDGDTLNLGSEVQGNGQKVVQVLNIENSRIETDREINAGIISDSNSIDGITNVTTIEDSTLIGGSIDP
jgi:hypothetical protein